MRVLIAENDKDLADTIQNLVQAWGHQARVCGRGKETLREFTKTYYDLVLTEVILPDMSGDEFITRLRALSPSISVVTMTWDNSRELESRIRAQGVLYYMVKPFETESLKSLLEHLSRKSPKTRRGEPRGRPAVEAAGAK